MESNIKIISNRCFLYFFCLHCLQGFNELKINQLGGNKTLFTFVYDCLQEFFLLIGYQAVMKNFCKQ